MPFKVGDVVDGKFRIEGTLGAGGMGTVFAARHLGLDRDVALKVLTVAADPAVKERFLREARAVAKLETDAVAQVFDIGSTKRGVHYIVMERLRGCDLGALVRQRGPLHLGEAVALMLEACEPLQEAHAAGIIHRDLKPQNLFLAETRQGKKVKLLDFGVSRLASSEETITGNEEILGTPRFMPPEQLLGAHRADARSDVYSAGACLFVLLTAEAPIRADSLSGLLHAIRNQIPQRIDELRPEIPAAIADVVARCLEKDPARRFQSIAELAAALAKNARAIAEATPPPTRHADAHLDDEAVVALQEGRLAGAPLQRVQIHLAECADCRELVSAAASSLLVTDATISDNTKTGSIAHSRHHLTEAPVGRASPATVPLPGNATLDSSRSMAGAPPTLQSPQTSGNPNTFSTLVSGDKASARTARTHEAELPRRAPLVASVAAGTALALVALGVYATRARPSNDHAPSPSNASAIASTPVEPALPSVAPSAVPTSTPTASVSPASSASSASTASSAPSPSAARARSRSPATTRPSSPPSISNDIPNER